MNWFYSIILSRLQEIIAQTQDFVETQSMAWKYFSCLGLEVLKSPAILSTYNIGSTFTLYIVTVGVKLTMLVINNPTIR